MLINVSAHAQILTLQANDQGGRNLQRTSFTSFACSTAVTKGIDISLIPLPV